MTNYHKCGGCCTKEIYTRLFQEKKIQMRVPEVSLTLPQPEELQPGRSLCSLMVRSTGIEKHLGDKLQGVPMRAFPERLN